jgi:hypothetical protein
MQFNELGQDVLTKILVAACNEQTLDNISRVNHYTRSTLFTAPLTGYGA